MKTVVPSKTSVQFLRLLFLLSKQQKHKKKFYFMFSLERINLLHIYIRYIRLYLGDVPLRYDGLYLIKNFNISIWKFSFMSLWYKINLTTNTVSFSFSLYKIYDLREKKKLYLSHNTLIWSCNIVKRNKNLSALINIQKKYMTPY